MTSEPEFMQIAPDTHAACRGCGAEADALINWGGYYCYDCRKNQGLLRNREWLEDLERRILRLEKKKLGLLDTGRTKREPASAYGAASSNTQGADSRERPATNQAGCPVVTFPPGVSNEIIAKAMLILMNTANANPDDGCFELRWVRR